MDSTLTVLGSCGGWPEPGRACSGYLLTHRGVRIVLDLGYGTAARLFTLLDGHRPDAVVITHAHPDHAVDLHALFRWLRFAAPAGELSQGGEVAQGEVATRGGQAATSEVAAGGGPVASGGRSGSGGWRAVPVFAASGVAELMVALDPADADLVPAVLGFRPLPAAPARIGPFKLSSVALPHYVPNTGVRLEAPGLCVAYTGDTGPDPALGALARDADLFIADCTDRGPLNLTAREAGAAAAAGNARRLLLTHFWPGADREACRRAAAEVFAGEILLADEGLEVRLSGGTGR